ncbi:MAG: hypothetical protein M3256_27880, partial [Actinomycetota bacterium]|nr:hypothetical protein [Actinomycetota bacterium]
RTPVFAADAHLVTRFVFEDLAEKLATGPDVSGEATPYLPRLIGARLRMSDSPRQDRASVANDDPRWTSPVLYSQPDPLKWERPEHLRGAVSDAVLVDVFSTVGAHAPATVLAAAPEQTRITMPPGGAAPAERVSARQVVTALGSTARESVARGRLGAKALRKRLAKLTAVPRFASVEQPEATRADAVTTAAQEVEEAMERLAQPTEAAAAPPTPTLESLSSDVEESDAAETKQARPAQGAT